MQVYQVFISEVLAGYLTRNNRGSISFHFTEAYRELANRPILGQHFEDDLEKTYVGKGSSLPPFFANLIPESELRELLEHSLQLPPDDDLALLSAVGQDLPGAIAIIPGDESVNLVIPGGTEDGAVEEYELVEGDSLFRFSLAGVQMKFSVAREGERLTIPGHGALGEWIVKLDSPRFPQLTDNEYATMQWAKTAGFNVPDCMLLSVEMLPPILRSRAPQSSKVFLIRRYDRQNGRRIHQEDFAQVTGLRPALKYEHISYEQCARIVLALCGQEGYDDFIRRLVFMVASGNADAHLKNWSLLYPDGYQAELTPLYDQVVTIAWSLEKGLTWGWALKFAGTKSLYVIDETTFQRLAERAGANVKDTLRLVKDTVIRIASAWTQSVAPDYMPHAHLQLLRKHWERVPLLKDCANSIQPRSELFHDEFRAELLVTSTDGILQLVAETKRNIGIEQVSVAQEMRERASNYAPSIFYLLVSTQYFWLWAPSATAPTYQGSTSALLGRYIDLTKVSLERLKEREFGVLVYSWLSSIIFKSDEALLTMPGQEWLVETGVHSLIYRGYIKSELTAG